MLGNDVPPAFSIIFETFFRDIDKGFVERKVLYKMHYIKVSRRSFIILKNGLQLEKIGLKNADFFRKKIFWMRRLNFLRKL